MDTQGTYIIEERPEWRLWVTPRPLREKPIHRWYIFPHSFASELVHGLIDEWGLDENDHILDNFCGAGTTILAAREKGIPATGFDLSPHAVFVSNVKTAFYSFSRLETTWVRLEKLISPTEYLPLSKDYPDLVVEALPGQLLFAFDTLNQRISQLDCTNSERDFFRLALLNTIPEFSRAVATGGWLKWVEKDSDVSNLPYIFAANVESMFDDLNVIPARYRSNWHAVTADSRELPVQDATYSAVITSPPYPNRHDYTRVFGVELMFEFLNWEETRDLRYQSIQSHPEAKPVRPETNGYVQPKDLVTALDKIEAAGADRRIPPMLAGYFIDMYLSLAEVDRVCIPGTRIAFVVGNVQYCGVPFLVDEWLVEVGEHIGIKFEKIQVVRFRCNSAQQMKLFGKHPSRESIVIFRKN